MTEWILKKTHKYAAYKRLTSDLKTHSDWKWEDGKKHANGSEKKAGVAILISGKDIKTKTVTRDKEWHCKMIKGSIQKKL